MNGRDFFSYYFFFSILSTLFPAASSLLVCVYVYLFILLNAILPRIPSGFMTPYLTTRIRTRDVLNNAARLDDRVIPNLVQFPGGGSRG